MTWLLLVAATALSATAAFYSVTGLMAIFAAAPVSIAIMGSVLEFSKLVVASWLWRNWSHTGLALKSYLTTAVILLIALTSLGTYGYLSAAHAEAGSTSASVTAQLQHIDAQLADQRAILDQNAAVVRQLDTALNEIIGRSTTAASVQRALAIRQSQAAERRELATSSTAIRDRIAELATARQPLAAAVRTVEAKAGPLQHIARLAGQDTQANTDTAIRLLIVLIVSVFDPLAVLMFIAYNQSVTRAAIQSTPQQDAQQRTELPQTNTVESSTREDVPESTQPGIEHVIPESPHPPETQSVIPESPHPGRQPPSTPDWERDRKLEPLP